MKDVIPSFLEFESLWSKKRSHSFLKPIDLSLDPFAIYCLLYNKKTPSIFLESARSSQKIGRFSYIAKDPFLIFQSKGGRMGLKTSGGLERREGDPFDVLKDLLEDSVCRPLPGFPPFTGGAAGYFGYEVKNLLESKLTQHAKDDLNLPDIYLPFFDEGIVFDHKLSQVFLFANIKEGLTAKDCYKKAQEKIQKFESQLLALTSKKASAPKKNFKGLQGPLQPGSSLTREAFMEKVRKTQHYIRKGDIFQANISQRFDFPLKISALEAYERLRSVNPASFFGIMNAVDFQIVSGSPERLLKLHKGVLQTRPIAGTRSRGQNKHEDEKVGIDLLLNDKERAEHIMLLDLERNDLGRVCKYGSVCVDELMTLEDYSHVKHIVSNVTGVLKEGLDGIDALRAFFPGGTITGTPKIRCMQIIDELEPVARGPYTGSLGYFGFNGNMDLNIIIRSLVLKNQRAYLHVGAGIVADSKPDKEYEETLYKAQAVFAAIFGEKKTKNFLRSCSSAV